MLRKILPYLLFVAIVGVGATVMFFRDKELEIVIFEDVTHISGLDYRGTTHGAFWGDFDADGRPDLYLTNHLNDARLYRNNEDGQFVDVTDSLSM